VSVDVSPEAFGIQRLWSLFSFCGSFAVQLCNVFVWL
jgi:hypothetical protein